MDPKAAKALREPFPPEKIGKLPRAGIQLDYVGHATVTDRLLEVDPDWWWEPMGVDQQGLPVVIQAGLSPQTKMGLWIRMTVAGVTRPGFGDGNTIKECISDAIRNAAMRFGVALALWSKEDFGSEDSGATAQVGEHQRAGVAEEAEKPAAPATNGKYISTGEKSQQQRLFTIATKNGVSKERVREIVMEIAGVEHTAEITVDKYDEICHKIQFDKVPFQ